MEIEKFIENYREAFGEAAGLPVVFWYSDEETGHTEKIGGCFFKGMQEVRAGNTISLNAEVIGCGGGKFYTGFAPMPEHVPGFVSLKEKYKKTPGMVKEFVDELGIPPRREKIFAFCPDRSGRAFRRLGRHLVFSYTGYIVGFDYLGLFR